MAKILLVDDSKMSLELYQDILLNEGFTVLIAQNGEEVLPLAINEHPDLIIIDIMMPGIDGGEISQKLMQDENTKGIPFVFLTSAISEEEVDDRTGGWVYIAKSTPNKVFIQKIKDFLEKRLIE